MVELRVRPGTSDQAILNNVVKNNEYRLPDDMAGWTVLDIGAHIGSFVLACAMRGATRIVAIEPHPENFKLLDENCKLIGQAYPTITLTLVIRDAISQFAGMVSMSEFPIIGDSEINTGGSVIVPGGSTSTSSLDCYLKNFPNYDLLKLDCEGCEWDLFGCLNLDKVNRIVGEFHGWGIGPKETSITHLKDHLERNGFDFEYFYHPDNVLGMFFATRKEDLS